ncbi:MAG: OsmC family peroxiredoxin [Cytophagales bacterium]|nr:MAG: OsmC family peroxiredoxin [Cytophagales bacterium]
MNIKLNRKNKAYHFEAINETGQTVHIDANPSIGGENKGARPMELLIMGLGGCSAIDILSILKKQKIEPKDMTISINAQREKDAVPSLFKEIHIKFTFFGEVDSLKAEKAIQLSLDKYCSVAKTLESTAKITYSFEILN